MACSRCPTAPAPAAGAPRARVPAHGSRARARAHARHSARDPGELPGAPPLHCRPLRAAAHAWRRRLRAACRRRSRPGSPPIPAAGPCSAMRARGDAPRARRTRPARARSPARSTCRADVAVPAATAAAPASARAAAPGRTGRPSWWNPGPPERSMAGPVRRAQQSQASERPPPRSPRGPPRRRRPVVRAYACFTCARPCARGSVRASGSLLRTATGLLPCTCGCAPAASLRSVRTSPFLIGRTRGAQRAPPACRPGRAWRVVEPDLHPPRTTTALQHLHVEPVDARLEREPQRRRRGLHAAHQRPEQHRQRPPGRRRELQAAQPAVVDAVQPAEHGAATPGAQRLLHCPQAVLRLRGVHQQHARRLETGLRERGGIRRMRGRYPEHPGAARSPLRRNRLRPRPLHRPAPRPACAVPASAAATRRRHAKAAAVRSACRAASRRPAVRRRVPASPSAVPAGPPRPAGWRPPRLSRGRARPVRS
jgi:hypothetical protein